MMKYRKQHRGLAFMLKTPTLSKDYFAFAITIFAAVCIFSLAYGIAIYHVQKNHKKILLREEADRVLQIIRDSFDYTERSAKLLGKKIVQNGADDPAYIANIYRQTTLPDRDPRDVFSWSLFDWVNKDNMQTVNTRYGIAAKPRDMSMRTYTVTARKEPWKLQVSQPVFGYPSGIWIVPIAMGVANAAGEHVGIIVAGINISRLKRKVEQALREEVSFVVVGKDIGDKYDIIIASSNVLLLQNQQDFIQKLLESQKAGNKDGYLKKPFVYEDITFNLIEPMKGYPYYIVMGYHKDVVLRDFFSVILPRVIEFICMGGFCFILLLFFRKKIITPITALSKAADKISQGNLRVVIPRSGSYELDSLAEQLDQVVKYVQELQRIRQELTEKTEAAESANRTKSEFLACMSHELRTPLNAVIAFSEILKEEMFGSMENSKYQEYAHDIYSSGTHLLGIINDILDISKAEAGMIVLQKHPVNIPKVIGECITIVSDRAYKGGVKVTTLFQEGLPPLVSDELRLKQIIINLLSNAIKFTPEGGEVTIRANARIRAGMVTDYYIVIHDTGIGMEAADIPKAIEKFGQLDTGLNRKFEGTGLGLPLTKKLVEIHQGTLSIESTPGIGTTVTLHFPQSHMVAELHQVTPLREIQMVD